MEKNLNKVRTIHPISRSVEFKNVQDAAKFVNLYKDLFYKPKDDTQTWGNRSKFGFEADNFGNSCCIIYFTIKKSDWVDIEKNLCLKKDNSKYHRDRYIFE